MLKEKTIIEFDLKELKKIVSEYLKTNHNYPNLDKLDVIESNGDWVFQCEVSSEIYGFSGLTLGELVMKAKKSSLDMSVRLMNVCKREFRLNVHENIHRLHNIKYFGKKSIVEIGEVLEKIGYFNVYPEDKKHV